MVVNKLCITGEPFSQSIKFLCEVVGVMPLTRPVVTLMTILFAVVLVAGGGSFDTARLDLSRVGECLKKVLPPIKLQLKNRTQQVCSRREVLEVA